jgi:hypothetical protein
MRFSVWNELCDTPAGRECEPTATMRIGQRVTETRHNANKTNANATAEIIEI